MSDNRFLEQVYAGMVQGTIVDGRKIVTTAGTRVQLIVAATSTRVVIVTALSANTDIVVVGSTTVVAAAGTRRGIPLTAGQSVSIGIDNLNKLWLDSVVDGEGISYAYLV